MAHSELIDSMLKKGIKFPALPSTLVPVSTILRNQDSSLAELVSALNLPSITVRLLQIANSPALRSRVPISTVSDAVQFLGRQMVKNIVLCVSMRDLFSCSNRVLCATLKECWDHSTTIASISAALAPRFSLDIGESLAAGILHDIGVLPVVGYFERQPTPVDFDALVLDNSAAVGRMVMETWGFPDALVQTSDSSVRMPAMGDRITYADVVSCAHYAIDGNQGRLAPLGITVTEFTDLVNSDARLQILKVLR